MIEPPIKVLLAKIGVDIHDVGIRMIARYLRDNGLEVVYLGYALPHTIVETAIEEDVDVIGVSSMQGMHHVRVPEIIDLLKKNQIDIPVIVGGIIPPKEIDELLRIGVKAVFPPGSSLKSILETFLKLGEERKRKILAR
jgi:methylmalonyl-CoA mutase C-terminal domain/subunit